MTMVQSVPLSLGQKEIVGLLDCEGKRETQENKVTLDRGVRKEKKAIMATHVTKEKAVPRETLEKEASLAYKRGEGRNGQSW